MKRVIAVLLTFFYVGVSSANNLYLHYCMGELKGMSFTQDHTKNCDNCGMLKSKSIKKGCCEEKLHQIKIEKDQRISSYSFQFTTLFPVYLNPKYGYLLPLKVDSISESHPVSHAPPDCSGHPVYLVNRTFRI